MADLNAPSGQPLGVVGSVSKWLQQPFNSGGSALNWVLWLGLVLCAMWFWTSVLRLAQREIPEV